jgi:hypothetical protein
MQFPLQMSLLVPPDRLSVLVVRSTINVRDCFTTWQAFGAERP